MKNLEVEQYIENHNHMIEKSIATLLCEMGKTLACAESCTGGNIAHLMTCLAGASNYFKGGIVSYVNEIKRDILGVRQEDLDKYTAVSHEVVEQMAVGVRERFSVDYAIATSGIAGPGGGSCENPVGTVWIAIVSSEKIFVNKYLFEGDRNYVIEQASFKALSLLLDFVDI